MPRSRLCVPLARSPAEGILLRVLLDVIDAFFSPNNFHANLNRHEFLATSRTASQRSFW